MKNQEFAKRLVRGVLDHKILEYLEREPMHGYGIIQRFRRDYGFLMGASTVYPALQSLEKQGFVKSCWDMRNERPRKVYEITKEGKNELDKERMVIREILGIYPEALVRA